MPLLPDTDFAVQHHPGKAVASIGMSYGTTGDARDPSPIAARGPDLPAD